MRTRGQKIGQLATAGMLAVILAAGCATRVDRMDMEETRDLSGRWNDTDSRLVSAELIEDMLSRAWLDNHERRTGDMPTVIVGDVRNLTHEHINVNTFIADIERAVINSGQVSFVAGGDLREAIRRERLDQDLHARGDTRNPMGMEIGADYMLSGTVNSIVDVEGRRQVIYYQVNLALTSIADNRRVWIGQKEIRKFVERSRFRS